MLIGSVLKIGNSRLFAKIMGIRMHAVFLTHTKGMVFVEQLQQHEYSEPKYKGPVTVDSVNSNCTLRQLYQSEVGLSTRRGTYSIYIYTWPVYLLCVDLSSFCTAVRKLQVQ